MEGPVMKLRVESALTVRLIEFYGTFDGYEDKKCVPWREKQRVKKAYYTL